MGTWQKCGALAVAWLALAATAQAQFGPTPQAPHQGSDPLPLGPSAVQGQPAIWGPLRTKDAPPGPDPSLGLPDKIPNAFGGEMECSPGKELDGYWSISAGVQVLKPRWNS